MTIQSIKELKENSITDSHKFHFNLLNETLLFFNKHEQHDNVINNIFTASIYNINCVLKDSLNNQCYVVELYSENNIFLDTVSFFTTDNSTSFTIFKKLVHPLSKSSHFLYKIYDIDYNSVDPTTIFDLFTATIVVNNYQPYSDFNNNYQDLNPQYNPDITQLFYESSDDSSTEV